MEIILLLQKLSAERTRIGLTIIAIAWSILSLTLMLAVGEGMLQANLKTLKQLGGNTLNISGGMPRNSYLGNIQSQVILSSKDYYDSSKKLPKLTRISPEYITYDSIQYGEQRFIGSLSGVNQLYPHILNLKIVAGRFINDFDVREKKAVIVLTQSTAESLFNSYKTAPGHKVMIGKNEFTVIGIIDDIPTQQRYTVFIPYTTLQVLYPSANIEHLLFSLPENIDTKIIEKQMRKIIAQNHHLNPEDTTLLNITDNREMLKTKKNLYNGIKLFLGLIGAVTLIIASFGITSVICVSIQKDTSEIGLRMALGAKSYYIAFYYLAESLIVTLSGGIIGLTIATLSISLINQIDISFHFIDIEHLQLQLPWQLLIIIITILCGVGLVASIYPIRLAIAVNPAFALMNKLN